MDTKSIEEKTNSNMQLRLNIWVNGQRGDILPVDIFESGYKADREDVVRVIGGAIDDDPIDDMAIGWNAAIKHILTHLNLNS